MLRSPAVLLAFVLAATPVAAVTIDFDNFAHGDIVAAPVAKHAGYTLVAENQQRTFDAAIAFDSDKTGTTADPDLQRGSAWATGNIKDNDLGRILILQTNDDCTATHCANPDDE